MNEFNLGCYKISSPFRGVAEELLLGSTGLGTLGTVFAAALGAVLHACGIESAADDVVAYTGKVLHTAAAHHYDGVLLQVVAFAGDVGVHFLAVGQAHTCDLTHCRIRLFGGGGVHTHTDTATLGARIQSGALALVFQCHASFAY